MTCIPSHHVVIGAHPSPDALLSGWGAWPSTKWGRQATPCPWGNRCPWSPELTWMPSEDSDNHPVAGGPSRSLG